MQCADSPSIKSEPNASTAPLAFERGPVIVATGAVLFGAVEIEKRLGLGWRNRARAARA